MRQGLIVATLLAVCMLLFVSCETTRRVAGTLLNETRVTVAADKPEAEAPLAFAEREISKHAPAGTRVEISVRRDATLPRDGEAYTVERNEGTWRITGNGTRGAMYGGLELAEHAFLFGNLDEFQPGPREPFLGVRQYKFNLPLVGTGYLSEEAEQKNSWFYDMEFWQRFFEMCARNRYNEVSFWSSNPWFHMARVAKYPESQVFSDAELDEKIAHFHRIFQLADAHGVDVSIYTWNVYVSPAFAEAHDIPTRDGKAGGVSGATAQWSEPVMDFVAEAIAATLREYPEIKIIGTTPGENMYMRAPQTSEWIAKTYLEGIRRSGRAIPFAIRYWGGEPNATEEWIGSKHSPTWLTIKFNGESMYSSTEPHFYEHPHDPSQSWLRDKSYQIVWHLRNDDLYLLRWGNPEFAREVMKSVKQYNGAGYLVGSEIVIPGEDFVSSPEVMARRNWKYLFERHWPRFMVWGKLGYDPKLPDAWFERHFVRRFGPDAGPTLHAATVRASEIFPRTMRFHWNYMNGDMILEGNVGAWNTGAGRGRNLRRQGESIFHDVLEWAFNHTIDDGYQNIPQYVTARVQGKSLPGRTPLEVADALEADALETLRQVDSLMLKNPSGELLSTVDDLRATAGMGLYYAEKIRGAVELVMYLATAEESHHSAAVEHLEKALLRWKEVAAIGQRNYVEHEIWLQGQFSWAKYTPEAERDIEIARRIVPNPEAFKSSPFWNAENFDVPNFNFNNAGAFGLVSPDLNVSLADLDGAAKYAALVFGRDATSLAALPESYRRRLLVAVENGATLILFNQDFPALSYKWLPGGIDGTDVDQDRARVVKRNALTKGIEDAALVWSKVANDPLDLSGFNGWEELIAPGMLAVRPHGRGRIIACQLAVLVERDRAPCKALLANLATDTKVSAERPWLVLDWGRVAELRTALEEANIPATDQP